MSDGRFVLTADVDWASEYSIRSFIDYTVSNDIVPTLFVTHQSAVIEDAAAAGEIDLGIHPNFMPGSTHGATVDQVLDHVFDLVPDPVASRSHCFFDNSAVSLALAQRGIAIDSNICCHLQEGLPVLQHWNGVKRLPVFFEDDVHWTRGGGWSFADHQPAFESPGLKILNFHPFMWALNVPDAEFYEKNRAHITTLAPEIANVLRFSGQGSATFLENIIQWVRQTGGRFVSLRELCETA
ncbi:hypothetical protein [Sphingobium fluviale]|uniref:ChbG/HpnK family deacetylase n=1 Tax=Sphingobium fluviale TaxID=2506423 RepID=A0A4Q1KMH8_9SPHN|nr:hypothetical protein [Sphingobium fluviale]RXR30399.1 hypothetical protein EQG66_03530 [Sphingobium fluviale]